MLFSAFKKIFELLIVKLPPDKKEKAWELFTQLLAVLAYNASKGAAEGVKNG